MPCSQCWAYAPRSPFRGPRRLTRPGCAWAAVWARQRELLGDVRHPPGVSCSDGESGRAGCRRGPGAGPAAAVGSIVVPLPPALGISWLAAVPPFVGLRGRSTLGLGSPVLDLVPV